MDSSKILLSIEQALPVHPQPYNLNQQRPGLIIVDEVNGFCTVGYGALAPLEPNEQIRTMVSASHQLAQKFTEQNLPILLFLDTHEPSKPEPPYPPHCEKGSGEENLVPELEWLRDYPGATLVTKDCINGFIGAIDLETGNNTVLQWLEENQIEVLIVVGICTDICVMDFVVTILSVRNHGMTKMLKEVVVYADGCATYDLSAEKVAELGLPQTAIHPQQIAHHVGLYTMAERGAFIASDIL
jgi:nicotinamidase-related amidase